MNRIIVNADDFGLKPSVNKAIIALFEKGIIHSATLMANMPALDEAVELAFQHEITHRIGIHLVLTDGIPLTEEMKSIHFLFNGKGSFNKYRYLLILKKYQTLIYHEFAAQIEKIQSKRISITHLDTHHHVHEVYSITKILVDLQKKYQIPSIRILNNLEKSNRLYKGIYRKLVNDYMVRKHVNYSDYFGNRCDFLLKLEEDAALMMNRNIEIMVHPDFNFEGKLIDKVGNEEYDFTFLQELKINKD